MPVFISHSHENNDVYDGLRDELAKRGIEAWHYKTMTVGDSLETQLRAKIDRCPACIFVASKLSLESGWCQAEIGAFWGAGKAVLIYAVDPDIQASDIPEQFQGKLWTSDRAQLIDSVEKHLYPHGRLRTAETQTSGAVVVLSQHPRDEKPNEAIENTVRKGTMADRLRIIDDFKMLLQDELDEWGGLFLSMPFQTHLSEELIHRIVQWVRRGRRLVMCGYELGQWHHKSNINQLAAHFGFQFRSDVVVGSNHQANAENGPSKQYGMPHTFTCIEKPEHPIFRGVGKIELTNACSLYLDPGSCPMVLARPNRITELQPDYAKQWSVEQDRYQLAPGEQRFLPALEIPGRAVMAEGPSALAGKGGSVIGLGTWNFWTEGGENELFIQNLFGWLAERDCSRTDSLN